MKAQHLLKGAHLISLGFSPGEEMGKILKEAFELQLENSWDIHQLISWAKELKNQFKR
jgi:hypothetical protein